MLEERIANITDLHFICGCILYGGRKGHYSIDVDNPDIVKSMKREMQSVINSQRLLDTRHARATIYSIGGKRIAMVIISEASPGDSCYEIYAMSVIKSHQNKGYGLQILDSVLNRFVYLDICARCLPASGRMSYLLAKRGFEFHSMDKAYTVLLRTAVMDYALVEPVYMQYGTS